MVPFGNLGVSSWCGVFFLTFFIISSICPGGGLLYLLHDDFLVAVVGQVECSSLFFALKADNANYLADVTLDGEELIHEAKLKALLLRLKFVVVTQALKKDVTLGGPVLGNLLLN